MMRKEQPPANADEASNPVRSGLGILMWCTGSNGHMKWCFTSQGQAPVYADMSLALFSNGYLAIVAEENVAVKEYMLSHLQELFEDVEVYGWKSVKEYHAAWLQLLEQGRAAWGDDVKKAQLRRLMVWSKAALSSKVSPNAVMTATPHPSRSQAVMVT